MNGFTPSTYGHSMQAAEYVTHRRQLTPLVAVTERRLHRAAHCRHCSLPLGASGLRSQCGGPPEQPERASHAAVQSEIVRERLAERPQAYVNLRLRQHGQFEAALIATPLALGKAEVRAVAKVQADDDASVPSPSAPRKIRGRFQGMHLPPQHARLAERDSRMPWRPNAAIELELAQANAILHAKGAR